MQSELNEKKALAGAEKLKGLLRSSESAVIAFSGGADSYLLLSYAVSVMGPRMVLAVTINTPLNMQSEIEVAAQLAAALKVEHKVIDIDPCSEPQFTANPPERCYICKRILFGPLIKLAEDEGFKVVLEGSNADDLDDYRPGLRAVKELGVRSPLLEAGLSKAEIRFLSRQRNLSTWDKPSAACLASRIPYGEKITGVKLKQVAAAEDFLRSLGLEGNLRVRRHGSLARIEVDENAFSTVTARHGEIRQKLKELGFIYVTLDLCGFRSGSLNLEPK
ncbi:MAG: ATP-dependent sacrificial sulfur transferase LarE [Bacillota bacterium]